MTGRTRIRELRHRLSVTIRKARAVEAADATDRGQSVVTDSAPHAKPRDQLQEMIASGQATAGKHSEFPMPTLRARPGVTTDAILSEDRAERI